MTSDEMLDQLRKLDELVQNADPDSIEWVMDVDLDDEPLTPNRVRALITFFEAEPVTLASLRLED